MSKYVYLFGSQYTEGDASMKNLLGGKGANLAEMCNLGIPVPAGFTITTEVCIAYYDNRKQYPTGLQEMVKQAMSKTEEQMGMTFGDPANPLLVSVRSGARASMPGMMDTVLNLGINRKIVEGLIKKTGNERFAWDSYRRFIQMYGDVVLGLKPQTKEEHDPFEVIIDELKKEKNIKLDTQFTASDLKELAERFKKTIKQRLNLEFPEDPWEQLWGAIGAVFGSWNNDRAITYRRLNKIPDDWGTAVNVQAMVYGNMGNDCATGVAFTRDPATGDRRFFGEYLINAQGEDVVAGIRTPQQITIEDSKKWAAENSVSETDRSSKFPSLEESMPKVYQDLVKVYNKLEEHYHDMQDIEFTIQQDKLYMLQTRNGKRTAAAAVKIAFDMVKEGLISKETAVLRVDPDSINQLLHPRFDPKAAKNVIARGLAASPGAAVGQVVFHAEDAVEWANQGKKVVLVRIETSPEDVAGMDKAVGILTSRGGKTSHAAVVARGMGKCCVSGCADLNIEYMKKQFSVGSTIIKEGDWISLDGSTGEVMTGLVPTIEAALTGEFGTLMEWADGIRRLKIRTNADTPKDATRARQFGAEGIGLTRTEHMFFDGERIKSMRKMILADTLEERKVALRELLPYQRDDFYGILKAMAGLPVTIRLLDPPLHEFLPQEEVNQMEMARELNVPVEKVKAKVRLLHELNPMLGHRGCRLGNSYPEISEMQARAIFEAACRLTKEGISVLPEVMVPLIGSVKEYIKQKEIIVKTAETVMQESGVKVNYMVGTMIEIPRAALTADEIAKEAEFFSFGTNDLTQMTFGFSRDDIGSFLPKYLEEKLLPADPFQTLDQEGVGQLVSMGTQKGRSSRPKLKVGICGEHGGDPESVIFCHKVGMDYVSCSPFRVPIARLAAAHAVLREKK
ncbi:MAG: pyruvate, phosphate dikinase [Candidatus Delongbacteria bacterium]|nr:pyruvate, phosphate dikinase [Candidatus Delongbacteria bacterium]